MSIYQPPIGWIGPWPAHPLKCTCMACDPRPPHGIPQMGASYNPAPNASAAAVPTPGTFGTLTWHLPGGDVTQPYPTNPGNPDPATADKHAPDCCCYNCRFNGLGSPYTRTRASDTQVGGTHYKGFEIQPAEFITKNKLGFLEGCAIKRLCRYDKPGGKGKEDLLKARHEIDLILEYYKETK